MNLFELTRVLIDIDSVTPNEEAVGVYLAQYLGDLAARTHGRVERIAVESRRHNVLAHWGDPVADSIKVTLSTHMDTVPPFTPSREDSEFIWGRGACDTKGIIAAMIHAVEGLLAEGTRGIALLFVVGEEDGSAGAYAAARDSRGSRYLINGEPTENKLACGTKGALTYDIVARGREAHSGYPHLGDSAIEKLLDALDRLRRIPLATDPVLGPSTLNIGTIEGGRKHNVIPGAARAKVMIRLVDSGESTRREVARAVNGLAEAQEVFYIPPVFPRAVEGFETDVVAYATDIPVFNGSWGEPFLLGPGSIHVAHTDEERIPKAQLLEAVPLYQKLVRHLLTQ